MPTYDYRAHDRSGRSCKGRQEADSPRHARQLLRERGLLPSRMRLASERMGAGVGGATRMSAADLALLTLQLSTLVQAGLPLEQALQAVAQQSQKRRVSTVLSQVRDRVMEGNPWRRPSAPIPGPFLMCCAPPLRRVSALGTWGMSLTSWRRIPKPVRRRARRSSWRWCIRRC